MMIKYRWVFLALLAACCLVGWPVSSFAADEEFVPRRQSGAPGPPLSPEDAIAKMTVPEGFSVELVAAEPDLVNPVAMTFDEQGRIWVTESVEYPRSSPGVGKDRIKVLEDTNQDGRVDKVTIFAEGLNIPSGIAVGYGGVWVANAPDILFLQDTDGDLKADKREVVVTGFGRTDTHELPNSLTWGPDGFLYGLNGVFNYSHVKHRGKDFVFTCALFRIDPRTRDFELFSEGTSNPWGIAFDPEGSAFVSACVIDHLWHLTESGYYHRQGGPYPPHTWKIESIVDHKHQMAAYCGIEYFDSDAYPEKYRDRLYMGNIHGGCINVDVLQRSGSTYTAQPNPDFLTANDVWHMPVDQKTGPDGCLYVLDWYDRYHCYQDARARPADVDRLKGRLYRVRYQQTPRAENFNLADESGDELVERLHSKNRFYRNLAQRVLSEGHDQATTAKLEQLVFDTSAARKTRMHALWSLIGARKVSDELTLKLLQSNDDLLRAWAVRNQGIVASDSDQIAEAIQKLSSDKSPKVRLQVAILAPQVGYLDTIPTLLTVLKNSPEDRLIPHIVWQNLHPLLDDQAQTYLAWMSKQEYLQSRAAELLPRAADRILSSPKAAIEHVASLVKLLDSQPDQAASLMSCLNRIAKQTQSRELTGERLRTLRGELDETLAGIMNAGSNHPGYFVAANLALAWNDGNAVEIVPQVFANQEMKSNVRIAALDAMLANGHSQALPLVKAYFQSPPRSEEEQGQVIQTLGKADHAEIADVLLSRWNEFSERNHPKVIEVLLQRPSWTIVLLDQIKNGKVPSDSLSVNQLQRLAGSGNAEINDRVQELYGTIRTGRDPARALIVARMRRLVTTHQGNPKQGVEVYNKLCGQCHKLYGQGQEVGPDITVNGRGSLEALLSNVFDPSLVIGKDYQAVTLLTVDGRVLSGLLVEDSPTRVVLKMQGAKLETIARDDVDAMKRSDTSLMPEGIEKQLKPQEIADLFAYLTLTKPPADPAAEQIAGSGTIDLSAIRLPQSATNMLAKANFSSNVEAFGKPRPGSVKDLVFLPNQKRFLVRSKWHEIGVGVGADLGIVPEEKAVSWTATWQQPQSINLITLSGAYPNQVQPNTAWSVDAKIDGKWEILERGIGDWFNNGRFVWGWPGTVPVAMEGLRVRIFSPDEKSPLRSIHFRGDLGFSWFAGELPAEAVLLSE